MKKAFTLIELLAVIVILTIILVVIIPKIMNLINNSDKRSVEISSLNYINSLKKCLVFEEIENNTMYYVNEESELVLYKTFDEMITPSNISYEYLSNYNITDVSKPDYGYIIVNESKIKEAYLIFNGYEVICIDYICTTYDKYKGETITTNIEYDYTGNEEVYEVHATGYYLIEAWGASGGMGLVNGKVNDTKNGYGAYITGIIYLKRGTKLYINVGGKGEDGNLTIKNSVGGYNGGGNGSWDGSDDEESGAGGGATSLAFRSGLLETLENNKNDIIAVASGGGGSSFYYAGGSGGGIYGGITNVTKQTYPTQTDGYAFGKGENGIGRADSDGVGGGGGGFYGGYANNVSYKSAGTGGSSYLKSSLINKAMYCYNCITSDEIDTKTISVNSVSTDPISNTPKKGNGYLKISLTK